MPDQQPPAMQSPAEIDAYLRDCVKIEPLALEEEFIRLPGDMAYWNARYAEVYRYWLERKFMTEQIEARRGIELHLQLEATRPKPPTIAELSRAVQTDPEYIQARGKEIVAEAEKVRLAGVVESLRAKREMLVSVGAHIRAEWASDPTLRERDRTTRDVHRARTEG